MFRCVYIGNTIDYIPMLLFIYHVVFLCLCMIIKCTVFDRLTTHKFTEHFIAQLRKSLNRQNSNLA